MEKRLVTRYATRSTEAADENERRVQAALRSSLTQDRTT